MEFDEPLRVSARIKKKPQMMAKTIATAIHTPALPFFLGVWGAWGAWYCPWGGRESLRGGRSGIWSELRHVVLIDLLCSLPNLSKFMLQNIVCKKFFRCMCPEVPCVIAANCCAQKHE